VGTGLVVIRVGPLRRRIRLGCVTAVQVDRAKVSIGRSDGGEISVYVWRKSRLDGWLRLPDEARDVAHAIAGAAAAARDAGAGARDGGPAGARDGEPPGRRALPRGRRPIALAVLGCAGLVALGAAFLVRVSWPSPVMTAAGVLLALVLGVSGLSYVLFSLWLLLTGRASRAAA
jgi:hypothetical protein